MVHNLYCYYFEEEDSYCNFEIVGSFGCLVVHYRGQGQTDCNSEAEHYNFHY